MDFFPATVDSSFGSSFFSFSSSLSQGSIWVLIFFLHHCQLLSIGRRTQSAIRRTTVISFYPAVNGFLTIFGAANKECCTSGSFT